ncbi:MAG: sigma-54-dependent Fis family transcriptional regulator [Alphaproteobacteria bacterium]|nr:MAG: sigma-54-dependent Fis family transcriptional regulator [Alphaproteobacteria bacterium]
MALDILIVDDEADIRDLISGILDDEGYETRTAKDSDTALSEIEARRPSLIILDIWLQGSRLDGLELLDVIKKAHVELPVVIISGHGNIETAVSAIKLGAYDFISKPFETDKLLILVERATEVDKLRRENTELKEKMGVDVGLTGSSSAINLVRNTIDKVAPSGSRVLISGPPGSGKEVVARLIHKQSKRSRGAFIVINAASISAERMENELFGVEEDGNIKKTGVFEQAHGGTLFIDEVADMPQNTQAKILRILTDQTFERVGGNKKVLVNVRVISATSRDLRDQINNNLFREDLFHRLSVVPVHVPPLIQRREDIPALVQQIMNQLSIATGFAPKHIDADAMSAMQNHEWPGNVRQLRNVVERLLIMSADNATISLDMLPSEIISDTSVVRPSMNNDIMSLPLRDAREKFEREYLKVQVSRFSGNISRTAEYVGMERSALHRKLKSLGLSGNEKIS